MAHPHLSIFFHPFEQNIVLTERSQMCTTILTRTSRFYFPAIGIGHKLRTVANTQNRIFTPYLAQIYLERAFIIYRERTSGKNHTFYTFISFGKFVVGNNFTIRIQLAYTTTDKLRSLRPEIKDYYFFLHINGWILNKLSAKV